MRITLYNRSGNVITTLRPLDGKQKRQLLGVDIIEFKTVATEPLSVDVGAYFDFEGERYTLNRVPRVKKHSRVRYEYALTFEAPCYALRNAKYLFYGEDNDLARNGMAEFSLVGTPQMFLDLIVVNANRIGGAATWVAGTCMEAEAKEVSFSGDSCLGALQRCAQEFDTEFWFEGNKIHLARKEATLPYVFRYGKGNSLYDMERVDKDTAITTRLYAHGSERNLPYGYRSGTSRLKLPVSLGQPYLEQNVDKFGIIEDAVSFEDVYPHRTGKVTSIDTTNRALFFDSAMPFDLSERAPAGSAATYKYLQVGVKAKVKFNTGNLAGYEFELAAYKHASKQFTIIPINEKFGTTGGSGTQDFALPNAALYPQVGDEYVLLDIALPDEYVAAAEAELLAKAKEHLAKACLPEMDYLVTPNEIEFTRQKWAITLGATVKIVDEPLGIDKDIRVVGFTRSLDNLYRYESVELAEAPANVLAEQKYAEYTTQKQIDGATNLAAIANRRSSLIEDVTANYTTDIDGGLILTTLIQMRGDDGKGGLKTNAGISGLVNEANPVRFWAGSDFENRDKAPFRAYHDGRVVMSRASLKSANSGKRIEIISESGKIQHYNSSGVLSVEINSEIYSSVLQGSIRLLGEQDQLLLRAGGISFGSTPTSLSPYGIDIGDINTEPAAAQISRGATRVFFTLKGLPTSAQYLGFNEVWRDANGYLRIV